MTKLKTASYDLQAAVRRLIELHPIWSNRISVESVEGKWEWVITIADPQSASALAAILRGEADAVEFTDPLRPGREGKLYCPSSGSRRGIERHNFCRSARSFAKKLERA